MMLNKSHKLEEYQRPSANSASSSLDGCSIDLASSRAERESIHSGQFMVSHFEAEEAQDDLDDGEIKMPDPEDPSRSKPYEPSPCTEVQLYVPRKVTQLQKEGYNSMRLVTSQLEIETSLTKLFKCMSLAYSQKLTSPKWNHFKGVRLRWKDKIRLNNVIWRCWHMQFILKRRTPVCQFASPLDVDIHSNPQSVVLEGKYWKRQVDVIKAEYRKWRRNFKTQAIGSLTYDNRSDLDFLEWSPLNENRNNFISDDWTSDTLFSSINGPFPFPDQREIARGAGIADFIQPSLGPLQPNLDDIDLLTELLQNPARLAPVPEEGADEMLKNVDYGFQAMIGPEQIDSSNIMEVSSNNENQLQNDTDSNMLELNTPLNNVPFTDIEQQFLARSSAHITLMSNQVSRNEMSSSDTLMQDDRNSVFLTDTVTTSNSHTPNKMYTTTVDSLMGRQMSEFSCKSVIKGRISKSSQRPFRREPHNYDKAQPTLHQTTIYQQMLAEQQKTQQQHLQPSVGNHNIHNQTGAFPTQSQQQQQQQQQLQYASTAHYPHSPPSLVGGGSGVGVGMNVGIGSNYGYASEGAMSSAVPGLGANSLLSVHNQNASSKNFMLQAANMVPGAEAIIANTSAAPMMSNVKIEPPSAEVLSMFNLSATGELYGNAASSASNSYKPYPNVPPFKKSASTGTYLNMRGNNSSITGTNQTYLHDPTQVSPHLHAQSLPLSMNSGLLSSLQQQTQLHLQQTSMSPPTTTSQQAHTLLQQQQQQHQQQQQQQQQTTQSSSAQHGLTPKEMFRSNSLPLSVTFQKKDGTFAIPKHHVKGSGKSRSRSNSIQHHVSAISSNSAPAPTNGLQVTQQLQTATSDPMLNSTLAQLLTTNSRMSTLGSKQQSSSTSAISNLNMPMSTGTGTTTLPMSAATGKQSQSVFISPVQSSSSSSLGLTAPTTTQELLQLQHLKMQQQQQQQQQHKSPKKSNSLPAPSAPQMLHSPPGNKIMSYPPAGNAAQQTNNSNTHLSLSPESFHDQDSPLSPTHSLKYPRDNQRRAGHIHAEQKRRYNIKNGFDTLHALIPQLQLNPNAKLSKAAMLQKGAEHIKHLRSERTQLMQHMEQLRKERDALNQSLMHLHSILPANGAPVTRQGTEHVRQLYDQYVHFRTASNWKFWILGLILEPLLASYTSSVSSASMEELRRTAFLWIDQHCSLIDLRPAVSNKLKYLSMKTDILSDPPSMLQEEVTKAVNNTTGQHPNLHGT